MTATATMTMQHELQDVSDFLGARKPSQPAISRPIESLSTTPRDSSSINSEPPSHAVSALERWNGNKSNVFKTAATFMAFIVMGANDAAYGALIPYLQTYYNTSYTVVSLVFLSPFVGYIAAASTNNLLHKTVGQRGVAMIGPGAHLVAYIVICLHPPYPALVAVFILAGYGNGILGKLLQILATCKLVLEYMALT
jgi:predicted MFS family arabinose efflux permease